MMRVKNRFWLFEKIPFDLLYRKAEKYYNKYDLICRYICSCLDDKYKADYIEYEYFKDLQWVNEDGHLSGKKVKIESYIWEIVKDVFWYEGRNCLSIFSCGYKKDDEEMKKVLNKEFKCMIDKDGNIFITRRVFDALYSLAKMKLEK